MISISSSSRNERIQADPIFFSITVHAGFNPKKAATAAKHYCMAQALD